MLLEIVKYGDPRLREQGRPVREFGRELRRRLRERALDFLDDLGDRILEGLTDLIKKQLGPRGPGEFVIPGLLKLKTVKKKAIPAGERRNPFTGQMQHFPAKPASKKVRATALKALKDLIQ